MNCTKDSYNQFFNLNFRHVCKLPNNGKLMPRDMRGLISYCCDEHRTLDGKSYNEVCTAMITAMKSIDSDTRCNLKEWIKSRKQLVSFTQECVTRNLRPYESETIMCAKSCSHCHQRIGLRTRAICYTTNYCPDHEAEFMKHNTQLAERTCWFC